MWERLKDMRHEAENRQSGAHRWVPAARFVAERAWLLAGLASRRAPRRRPAL